MTETPLGSWHSGSSGLTEWGLSGAWVHHVARWIDLPIVQVRVRYHWLRRTRPDLKVREWKQSEYTRRDGRVETIEYLPPEVVEAILSETPAVPEFADDVRNARWHAQRRLRFELGLRIDQALRDDPKESNLEGIADLVGTDLQTVERVRLDYIARMYETSLEVSEKHPPPALISTTFLDPLARTAERFGITEAEVEAAHEQASWDREQYDWPLRPDWQLEPVASEDEQEEDAPGKAKASKGKAKIPSALRVDVLRRDKSRCLMCGRKVSDGAILHMDHIVPESKGGPTSFDNLQTLCAECNTGKGNRFEDDLRQ